MAGNTSRSIDIERFVPLDGGGGDTDTFRIGANFKGHAFIDDFNFQAGDTLDLVEISHVEVLLVGPARLTPRR